MDDGGSPGVEEVEAFENLPAPAPQNFGLHHLETFQIPVKFTLRLMIFGTSTASSHNDHMKNELGHCGLD